MKNQFSEDISKLFKDFYFLSNTTQPVLVGKLHPQLINELDYFTYVCSTIKSQPLYFLKNHSNVGKNKFQVSVPTNILQDSFLFAFIIHLGEYFIRLTEGVEIEEFNRRVVVRKNDSHFDTYDFWVNFIESNDYNDWHTHAGYCSGVIYADNAIGLPTLFLNNTLYNGQKGDIILFPSCLPHSVGRNESDKTRISYAFNLDFLGS